MDTPAETVEDVEKMLQSELDHLQDKEQSVKRVAKIVDEVCTVISRILY